MKQGKIYLYDQYVGLLTEDETGFTFAYDADYLASSQAEAVSLTLPLSDEPYHDTVLFPFFDGLIPEGWLLNIAESSWKSTSGIECRSSLPAARIVSEPSASSHLKNLMQKEPTIHLQKELHLQK